LRTTIKVFLRTEEKKREALRLKEAKDTPPATPVEPAPTPAAVPTPLSTEAPIANDVTEELKTEPSTSTDIAGELPVNPEDVAEKLQEAQRDIPQPSREVDFLAFTFCVSS
jgi:hypothetical protein